jgi:hypothetical protein
VAAELGLAVDRANSSGAGPLQVNPKRVALLPEQWWPARGK